ncbi:MAG TPA: glycosyltransferase [Candidatus Limnocylindrales bacterium]
MSGRVLFIAYYFPPLGGVGVQRTLKYARYLPLWGWRPVVVTPRNPAYLVRDPSLLDQLPADLEIERTSGLEPARLPNAVARLLSRGDRSGPAASKASAMVGSPTGGGIFGKLLWKSMIAWNRLWARILFPDAEAGWVGFAVRRGMAVHRREAVDVIYSTSSPISCHVAASRIAAKTGLRWIADFRDPWIGNAFAADVPRRLGRRREKLELEIVTRADRIVFATEGLREAYSARYPFAADRMVVITNGYDRADSVASGTLARDESPNRRFRLVYTGSLYGDTELAVFLDGLDLAVERHPELRDRLEVEFVGWLNANNRRVASAYTQPERLGSVLKFSDFLPHGEAMQRLAGADALLQIIGDGPNKGQIQGGKLMEYLGQDKQILAVVPEGVAREMLDELGWGICADPTPEGVASGLWRLLSEPLPTGRADPEGRYDRVNLARQLASILDELKDRDGPVE